MKITLCGTTKFKDEFLNVNLALTLQGHSVYSVSAFGHADKHEWTEEQKTTLDLVHFAKIEDSDAIYVIDRENSALWGGVSYIGFSTKREIEWAKMRGKIIMYHSKSIFKAGYGEKPGYGLVLQENIHQA